jgi:hypothetical protein
MERRLALKFRLNKIENAGIFGPILLNELFQHQGASVVVNPRLVQGYLQITTAAGGPPETCWHVWVETGGGESPSIVHDINQTLSVMNDPNFGLCQFCHLTERPPDAAEVQVDEEVAEHYALYTRDKKEFWKTIPTMKVRNIRAKIFRDLQ